MKWIKKLLHKEDEGVFTGVAHLDRHNPGLDIVAKAVSKMRCDTEIVWQQSYAPGTLRGTPESIRKAFPQWDIIYLYSGRASSDHKGTWYMALKSEGAFFAVLTIDTRWDKASISLSYPRGRVTERCVADAVVSNVVTQLNILPIKEAEVEMDFLFLDHEGAATSTTKRVFCPTWEEVGKNYLNTADIDRLMNMSLPSQDGKLILWHGEPGTGKTWLIRALARQWKEKMRTVFALEPEKFFGSGEALQMIVAASEESEGGVLVVMEDSADLVLSESRAGYAWHIGRLLNMTDGIFGDGINPIFLITINEKVGGVDPAITRPGRCLQFREFLPFGRDPAIQWLMNHGMGRSEASGKVNAGKGTTLAELYGILKGGPCAVSEESRELIGLR